MVKTNQFSSILIYLFFIVLLSISLFAETKFAYMKYIHAGIILFLLILVTKQLFVWHVKREGNVIILRSFFGIIKKKLNEDEDYLSVTGNINYDYLPEIERGTFLEIKTKKGKFKFYSGDYKNFDDLIKILFVSRIDLKLDYYGNLKNERLFHIDYTWAMYILLILFVILKVLFNL